MLFDYKSLLGLICFARGGLVKELEVNLFVKIKELPDKFMLFKVDSLIKGESTAEIRDI
jgi:hypothetical protein